jgi:hypothetical protein
MQRKFVSFSQVVALAAMTMTFVLSPDGASAREFENPRVDGLLLDGCYRYPGRCESRRQANAFCRRRGFDEAIDWEVVNRGGLISTKRLGDGGTCRISCSVMTLVECD